MTIFFLGRLCPAGRPRPHLAWALLLAALLAAGAAPPLAAQAEAPPRRLALLVGLGSFDDSSFPDLAYAGNDVDRLGQWLASSEGGGFKPQNIQVLKDRQATRAAILARAEELVRASRPQDMVLLYFSTHGFLTPDKVVGIVAYDSQATKGSGPFGSPLVRRDSVLTRADLYDFLERLPAKRRAVIVDVCHGGQLLGQEGDAWTPASPAAEPPAKTTLILASCLGSERAWESKELKASIFTHYLLEGLNQSRGDLVAAFAHARAQTERQAVCEKDTCQTPYLVESPPGSGLVLSPATGG